MHVLAWGVLPAVLVVFVPLRPALRWRGFWWGFGRWIGVTALSLALLVGLIFSDFKTYSGVFRAHKELMGSYQPGAALGATLRYAKMVLKSADVVMAPLGADAVKGPRLAAADKPVLTVLVAGETARAQAFALNGYGRDTNPELAKRDITYFADVTSCGTATAVSLPCMFSNLTREGYSQDRAIRQQNLLDVLTHAGLAVEWWDNNTGHQGNAARVPSRMMSAEDDAAACAMGECTDAVFLNRLDEVAATMTKDTVLVLHMIGSHGPAYHLRYPPEFEIFTPACKSTDFAQCSTEEIVNAYDNTILFTDHILAQMIDRLAAQDRVIPALLYVSDHGESLGEDGLYLHGAPWFMAPTQQTHVPMLIWLSDPWRATFGLDAGCLSAKADLPASHDNLFHTVLGMLDIRTSVHDPALDLTQGCAAPA
jgi:lipid A ethanolaminephosphotransferase